MKITKETRFYLGYFGTLFISQVVYCLICYTTSLVNRFFIYIVYICDGVATRALLYNIFEQDNLISPKK